MRQVLPAMNGARSHHPHDSLRTRPWEDSRLVWALAISLLLHLSAFGLFKAGQRFHLWDNLRLPAWVHRVTDALLPKLHPAKPVTPPREIEFPMILLQVDPAQAATEAPKNAKYYADVNTRAAQPDPAEDTGTPKISGQQERETRTEDTKLSRALPLQPAPPKAAPAERDEPEEKPKPAIAPGSLTMAKPQDSPRNADGQAERPKPRTVAEAKARLAQQRTTTAGEKSRQDGAVRQRNIVTTLDALGTQFGAYDAAIVAAIQERWYGLLDERSYASDKAGKVVLEFKLNYDGRVTDMKVAENTVDELLCLLCQKAILDPSPFARWPGEMRRLINGEFREVRFTFYYN
jgi:outer membrane biosynthesis protein TonB